MKEMIEKYTVIDLSSIWYQCNHYNLNLVMAIWDRLAMIWFHTEKYIGFALSSRKESEINILWWSIFSLDMRMVLANHTCFLPPMHLNYTINRGKNECKTRLFSLIYDFNPGDPMVVQKLGWERFKKFAMRRVSFACSWKLKKANTVTNTMWWICQKWHFLAKLRKM